MVWGHAWAEHYSSHDGAKLSGSGWHPKWHTVSAWSEETWSLSLCVAEVELLHSKGLIYHETVSFFWGDGGFACGLELLNFSTARAGRLFLILSNKKKKIPSKTWTSVGALRQKLLSSAHASNLLVPDQQTWKTNCKAVHGTLTQRHLWWLPVNIVPFNVRRHQFLFLSFNNFALLFIGALQVHGHFFKKLWWG